MANQILLKKSSVASKVPSTSDLAYGELAINYADGKLYFKTAANTIDAFTAGVGSSTPTIVTDATTSRTLSASDAGKTIYFTSASAVTVTAPSGLGAAFQCEIIQGGAGKVTVAAGAGTTVNSPSGFLAVKAQYGLVRILAPVANTFILTGDYETNYLVK